MKPSNMFLPYAQPYIRWARRRPTNAHLRIINALERSRLRNGSLRACINTAHTCTPALEALLLDYILYLNHTLSPGADILLVDRYRYAARSRIPRSAPRAYITPLSGTRRYSTHCGLSPSQAIAFNLHSYHARRGDDRALDVITNLTSLVSCAPGSALILVGEYRPRSRRAFARHCRAMRTHSDTSFIIIDAATPPSALIIPALQTHTPHLLFLNSYFLFPHPSAPPQRSLFLIFYFLIFIFLRPMRKTPAVAVAATAA